MGTAALGRPSSEARQVFRAEIFLREYGPVMSMNSKKSITGTSVLVLLGLLALFAGPKWLTVLIPAAIFVWYAAGSLLRTGRN